MFGAITPVAPEGASPKPLKATLTKIADTNTAHADIGHIHPVTEPYIGFVSAMPKVGEAFWIFGDEMYFRFIRTSPVAEIVSQHEGAVVFRTANSKYQLTYAPA